MATLALDDDQRAACDVLSELVCMVLREDACEVCADQLEFSHGHCSRNVSYEDITIESNDDGSDVEYLAVVSDDEYDPMNPGIGVKKTGGIVSRADVVGSGSDMGMDDIAHVMDKIMPFLPPGVMRTISGIYKGALQKTRVKGPENLNVEPNLSDGEDVITVIDNDDENAAGRQDDQIAEQYLNDPEVHWAIMNAVQMYYNSLARVGRFHLSARKRGRRGNKICGQNVDDSRSGATFVDLCDDENDYQHCVSSIDEFSNANNVDDLDSYDKSGDLRATINVRKGSNCPRDHDQDSDITVIDCSDSAVTINDAIIRDDPHGVREMITDDDITIDVASSNIEKRSGAGDIVNCERFSDIVNGNIRSRDIDIERNVNDDEISNVVVTGAVNDEDTVVVGNSDDLLRDGNQLSKSSLLDTDDNYVEFDSSDNHGVVVDLNNTSANDINLDIQTSMAVGGSIPISVSKPTQGSENNHDINLNGDDNGISRSNGPGRSHIAVGGVDNNEIVLDIGFNGESGGIITGDHHSKGSELGRKRRRNRQVDSSDDGNIASRDLRLAIKRKSDLSLSKRPKLVRDGDTNSEILKLKALQRNLQSSSQFLVEEEPIVDVDSDPIEFSDISDAENVNLEVDGDDFDDELNDGGSATASSDDQFEPEFVGTIVPDVSMDPIRGAHGVARVVEVKERSSDKTFKPHRVKRRKSGPNSLPERYEKYSPIGTRIGSTRFICFKTPLKRELCRRLKHRDNWFTPDELFRRIVSKGHELGMVIDLTATSRFYNCEEITFAGVEYKKICCPDTSIPPESCVKRFYNGIAEYESKFANRDPLIGVHCCNGVNTTGYFVCRYMIEELGYSADGAIASFNAARGHVIEKQEIIDSLFALDEKHRSNCTHMIRYLDDDLDHELVSIIRPPESVTLPETENETSDGIDEDEEGENAELEFVEKIGVSTGAGIKANLDKKVLNTAKVDTHLSKVGSSLRQVRSGKTNIDGKFQQFPKSSKICGNPTLINSDEDDESSLIGGVRSPRPSSEDEIFDDNDDISEKDDNRKIQANVRKISEFAIMKKNKISPTLEKSQVRVSGKTSQSVGRGKNENILQHKKSPEKSSYSSSSSTSGSSGSGSSDSDSESDSNFSDLSDRSRTKIRQGRRDKKRRVVTTILRKRQIGNENDLPSTKAAVSPKPSTVTAASAPHTEVGQRAFVTQFMTACLATMYQNQQLIIAMNKKKLIADKMVMAAKAKSQTVAPPPPANAKTSSSSANQEIDPRFSKWVALQEKKRAVEAAMAAAAPPQASLDKTCSVGVQQELVCDSGKDQEHSTATLIVDSVDGIPVLPSPAVGVVHGASSKGVIVDSVDGIPVLPARVGGAPGGAVKGAIVGSVDGIPVLPSRALGSSSDVVKGAPSSSGSLVKIVSRGGRSNSNDLVTGNNSTFTAPALDERSQHAGYVEPPNVVPVPLPLGAIQQLNPSMSLGGPIRGIPQLSASTRLPQSIAPDSKFYPNRHYLDPYVQPQHVQPTASADSKSSKSVGVLQPKAMSGYEALQYYQMQTAKRIDLERSAPSSYSATSSLQITQSGGTVTSNASAKPANYVAQNENPCTSIESVADSNVLGRSDQDYRQGFDYRRGIGITDHFKANEDTYSCSTKFTAPIPSLLTGVAGGLSKNKKLPSLMDINLQSIPGYYPSKTAQESSSVAAKPSDTHLTNLHANLHQVHPELNSTASVISQHDSIGLPTVPRNSGSGRLLLGHEYRALAPDTWRGVVEEQHVASGVDHIADPQLLVGGYRGSFGDSILPVISHPSSAVGELESAAAYYVRTGLPPPVVHLSRPSGGQSGYQHLVQEAIKGVLGLADSNSENQTSNKVGTEDVENQRISLDERLRSIMNDESSQGDVELQDSSERQYKNY